MTQMDLAKIINDWIAALEKTLSGFPHILAEAKNLCDQSKYNEAFLLINEFIEKQNIKKDERFIEIDTDFFYSIH